MKEECGLCKQALDVLRPIVARGSLSLERVDIESDPELFRRYCLMIPVLEVEGGATMAWPFDGRAVERALR